MKSDHRAKKIIQGRENLVCQSLRRARRVQGTKGRPEWLCREVSTLRKELGDSGDPEVQAFAG